MLRVSTLGTVEAVMGLSFSLRNLRELSVGDGKEKGMLEFTWIFLMNCEEKRVTKKLWFFAEWRLKTWDEKRRDIFLVSGFEGLSGEMGLGLFGGKENDGK